MNELMSLEQLERLAKNPNYKMSDKQVARLNELRAKNESYRHRPTFKKETNPVVKHDPSTKEEPKRD